MTRQPHTATPNATAVATADFVATSCDALVTALMATVHLYYYPSYGVTQA